MKIAFCCSASKDYVKKYDWCVKSQKEYCKKYNIDFYLDDGELEPNQQKSEWYWRKVYTPLKYFDQYDIVAIVDIDIEMKPTSPDFRTVLDENSIYYVRGISKRPNSGFLPMRTNDISKKFLNTILERRGQPLPKYAKMIGENGYVIQYIKENPEGTKEIPLEWNCSQPDYKDNAYFLHYTNRLAKHYDL